MSVPSCQVPTTAGQPVELRRGLKARHMQLIALGGIIGSCYFLGTGAVVAETGPAAFLAYLLGGLIIYLVMVCLGELAVHIPISGSFIAYATDFISPAWACGMGWSYWLTWVFYVPSEMVAAGIIMHTFVPSIGTIWWAVFFGLLITVINLLYVGTFGETEFWLALIKIVAIIGFCIMAVLIFLGVIGHEGFLGSSVLLSSGSLFPNGAWIVFLTMVLILVNFQGSEIVGLAAGESKELEKTLPIAIRNVTYRIIALYVIPVLLLVTILPWEQAGVEESVFAAALNYYGFGWAGAIFSFVVLTAAISCSNSGLYGCVRGLYGLAKEGMAPKAFTKLNRNGVPQNAVLFTIACCWLCIVPGVYSYNEDPGLIGNIYVILLGLSGFSGAIAWISICWSQLNFRRRLEKMGYDVNKLKFKVKLFPYVTHFAIWVQVAALGVIAWHPDLRMAVIIGLPLLVIPIIWYKLWGYRYAPTVVTRIRFEDVFKV